MWKKLLVALIAFIGTIGVTYAFQNDLFAAGTTYNAGGNVSGRVNMAPSEIDPNTNQSVTWQDSNFGLQKGDKILMGTKNIDPSFSNEPLAWQLLREETYTDYGCLNNNTSTPLQTTICNNPQITSWFSMTTKRVGYVNPGFDITDFYTGTYLATMSFADYKNNLNNMNAIIKQLNNTISVNSIDKSLIASRNLYAPHTLFSCFNAHSTTDYRYIADLMISSIFSDADELSTEVFLPSFYTHGYGSEVHAYPGAYPRLGRDAAFSEEYWTSDIASGSGFLVSCLAFNALGELSYSNYSSLKLNPNYSGSGIEKAIRPAVYLDLNDVVFAVSMDHVQNNNTLNSVKEPQLSTGYTNIYTETVNDAEMKLRLKNSNLSATLNHITNSPTSTNHITQLQQDGTVYLNADAPSYQNSVVSALVFDATTHEFLYYKPLEPAVGLKDYEFDTTGMAVGKYKIAIVNEIYDETTTTPSYSSLLSDVLPLEIVEPLSNLTHTPLHGTSLTDIYKAHANGNVKANDAIATIKTDHGVGGSIINGVFENEITYKLISSTDSTHTNDTSFFEIPLDTTTSKPLLDAITGTPYIIAKPATGQSELAIGAYKYRVQAYDKNGDPVPAQLNNGTTVSGINPNQGLISDDILMVVYPHEDQISYTQTKHNNKFYTKNELNGSTVTTATDLGQISFQSGINIQKLQTDGYVIDNIKLVKTGTTTELSELQTSTLPTTLGDPITIVKKSGASFTGSITFDMIITFKESASNTKTAQLTKSGLVFEVPGDLRFAQQVNGTTSDITTSTLTKTYDPVTTPNNTFLLWANDSATTPLPKNSKVTYCIVDPATNDCDATGGTATGTKAYTIANQADGTTNITLNGPGTTKKDSTVRASLLDTNGNVLTYSDLKIEVEPAKQILTWEGDGVTQASGSTDTWEVSLPWSGGTDTYTIDELLNSATRTNKLAIKNNIASGATASIKYTLSLQIGPTDAGKVTISNASPYTLTITGEPQQAVYIEAERAGDVNYGPSAKAKLKLNISQLPVLSFTYDQTNGCSNAMTSGTTCTKASDTLGKLSIAPTVTNPSYSLVKAEQSLDNGQTYSNTAPNTFIVNTSNGDVNIGTSNLTNGKYKLTFGGSDGTNTLANIEVIFTVSDAAFNASTWTWEAGDVGSLSPVSGTMNTTTNEYDSSYQRVYAPPTSAVPDKLQVELKGIPSGASVTYALKTGSASNVITHATSAVFDVMGVGGKDNAGAFNVYVEATVKKTGYADAVVYLPIEITKYPQKIGFQNNNPIYLPNNGVCTTIPSATVTSTYSNYANPGNPITYAPDTGSSSSINVTGNQICSIAGASGSGIKIKATLNGDTNFDTATATKNVVLYTPGTITVTKSIQSVTGGASNITYLPDSIAQQITAHDSTTVLNGTASTNAVVANVELTGGVPGTSSYAKSSNTGNANVDETYFTVDPSTGDILLTQDITARDIFGHGSNIFYIQVDVTDPNGFVQTVDVEIVIKDAIAEFYFKNGANKLPTTGTGSGMYHDGLTGVAKYTEVYAPNGTITRIKTNRGDAVYSVDPDSLVDPDVIQFASRNTYNILNATDENAVYGGHGGKAYAKACINGGAGYQAQCIYAEVEITRNSQSTFAFAQDPLTIAKSAGAVVPLYKNHFDGQDVLISNTTDSTIADAGTYTQGSDQEIQVFKEGGPVTITATTAGNRNYEPATAQTTVNVTARPPQTLTIDVNPKPIYYGDTSTQAKIISGYKSNLPAYFTSSDTSIVDVNDGNTSDDASDPLMIKKVGTVDIEVCQTDQAGYQSGDPCPGDYGYKTITIQPRPIKLKLQDESIYAGEAFPAYAFDSTPVSGSFAGSDTINDFPLPANVTAMDGNNALANTDGAGSYPIQGDYSSAEKAGAFLSNYNVTIQDGTLTIKQDPSAQNWFYLEGATSGNQPLDPTKWYNEDIYVKLDPANASSTAGAYDEISDTTAFTNADKTKFLVANEDDNTKDVYFRINPNGGTPHAGAISDKQTTSVKIDKTDPKITGAKGTPSKNNILEALINTITFNTFFKPGVEVIINTDDPQPAGAGGTVSVSKVASVDYTIQEIDETTGVVNASVPTVTGNGSVDANGNISFKIPKVGAYKVCAIAHDNAGNDSTQECYYLNIKKIDVDIDGDGIPDFNDPDGDGCPDLNIILGKDSDGDDIKLNVAKKGESKPYLNIDTDGDGKPDINVDTDKDGKPDLNIMTVTSWKPTKCVTGQVEEYCTDGTLIPNINVDIQGDGPGTPPDGRPDINIDLDGDGIPDIDIDTDGDGIPDINVDTNRDGTPDEKVKKLDKWVIDPSIFEANGKKFQTMTGLEPDVIDEIRDGDFILVPSEGTHFQPGYTLVIDDITGTMDDGTRTNINTQVPGGQEIKYVYDVQLWDGTKHIQPDGKVKVKIPTIDGIENPKLVLEQPDGTYITVDAVIEDGHYVYETDFLGKVSVIGDKQTDKDPSTTDPVNTNIKEPVKGSYTSSIGGALTGDATNVMLYIMGIGGSIIAFILMKKRNKVN